MEKLRQAMLKMKKSLEQMAGALARQQLLEEQTLFSALGDLDHLRREQARCVREVCLQTGCGPEVCTDLTEMERLLAAADPCRQDLAQLLTRLKMVRGAGDYGAALEPVCSRLRSLTAGQLAQMEQSGALTPYRLFLDLAGRQDLQFADVEPIAAAFGFQIAFGLLGGKYSLTQSDDNLPMPEPAAQPEPAAAEEPSAPAVRAERPQVHYTPDQWAQVGDTPEDLAAALLAQSDTASHPGQLKALVVRLAARGRIMEALVLTKTLLRLTRDPWFEKRFQDLLHGSNLPLADRDYNLYLVQDAEPAEPMELYGRISAAFWAAAFPKQPYDHILYINIGTMVESRMERELPMSLEPVRQALGLLTGEMKELSFHRGDGTGLSSSVLDALASGPVLEQKRKKLMAAAAEKLNAPRSTISITGLETLMKNIMGPAGELGVCMKIIAEDRADGYARVQGVLGKFVKSDGTFSDDLLHQYIDAQWDALRRADRSIMLRRFDNDSPARNSLRREIGRRLEIMDEWLKRNARSAGGFEKFDLEGFRQLTGRLLQAMQAAVEAIDGVLPGTEEGGGAGLQLLRQTLTGIMGIIRGERDLTQDPRTAFAPLLTAQYLLLDWGGDPVLAESLDDLPGMEPWRMMLRHVAAEKCTLSEALAQIEDYQCGSDRYEDFGSAAILRTVLDLPARDDDQAEEYAFQDCRDLEDTFRGDVRLACAYGQIPEETKETLFTQLSRYRPLFIPDGEPGKPGRASGNYGHFRMLLDCLKTQAELAKARRREQFLILYEERAQQFRRDKLPPMLLRAKQEIDHANYATAEEYLTRFDAGELELPRETGEVEFNFHTQFISCADWYCRQCEQLDYKGRSPGTWGPKVLQARNFWSAGAEGESGAELLKNWPAQTEKDKTGAICRLLKQLGFRADAVHRRPGDDDGQCEVFAAEVRPAEAGREDYPHPVAKFGTLQTAPLYVVCLYGCKGAATLIDIMTKKLQLGGNTIVLMDGAMTMLERRRVAARFKTMTSGQNSFLLIDRVLLLYLAAQDAGNRQKALLQCTLPYTYEQLYSEGSGSVADEMFMGRIADRKSLCDPNGACLVYGGRQLGKTALLRRVESINHKPEQQCYAVYVEIKDQGALVFVEKLKDALLSLPVADEPLLTGEETDLDQICRSLERNIHRFNQLTVLVDEVDAYFSQIAEDNYNDIHEVVVLQMKYKGKIKFVFAGTHNVAATTKAIERNADIIKLNQPLCIRPLSSADAIELIRRPLAYLGFEIGQQQIALILANTNSYPGLIHLFCNSLVKSICDNYSQYYDPAKGHPPYAVSDEQLRDIFREKDIKREIERRVISTIKLNRKYSAVANLLAFLEYRDLDNGTPRLYGYTPEEVQLCNVTEAGYTDFLPDRMSLHDLDALMEEMERMGILWKNPQTGSYRFRQRDFLGYIGSDEQVMRALLGGEA